MYLGPQRRDIQARDSNRPKPGVLITEIQLRGMTGMELFEKLSVDKQDLKPARPEVPCGTDCYVYLVRALNSQESRILSCRHPVVCRFPGGRLVAFDELFELGRSPLRISTNIPEVCEIGVACRRNSLRTNCQTF